MTDDTIAYDGANWQTVMAWAHDHGYDHATINRHGDKHIEIHMTHTDDVLTVQVGDTLTSPQPGHFTIEATR